MSKKLNTNTVDKFSTEEISDRATFRLHTASRLIQQMSVTKLKAFELTQAQWRALLWVCTQPGATLQHLTAFAQISQPLMSQAVRALEGRGLVSRETPANDKRSSVIVATDEGVALYEQAFSAMMTVDEKIHAILGKKDTEKLKSLLNAIVVGFE